MLEIYKIFGRDWAHTHDFSDIMAIELFNSESYGTSISKHNGYALGKSWLNVNVAMWKADFERGYLFKEELYRDGKFPRWWLDTVLANMHPLSWSKTAYGL